MIKYSLEKDILFSKKTTIILNTYIPSLELIVRNEELLLLNSNKGFGNGVNGAINQQKIMDNGE